VPFKTGESHIAHGLDYGGAVIQMTAKLDPKRLRPAIERFDLMNDATDIHSWEEFTVRS
jgi:hypothetical protein